MFAQSKSTAVAAFDIDGRDTSKSGFGFVASSSKASSWWTSRWTAKKTKIAIASVIGVVAVAVAIALIIVLTGKDDPGNDNPLGVIPEEDNFIQIQLPEEEAELGSGNYSFPFSSSGELFVLFKQTAEGAVNHDTPAGRSYDGNPWDSLHPVLPIFECNSVTKRCRISISDDDGNYTIRRVEAHERSEEELIADFLIHATFGPTMKSIQSFPSGTDLPSRMKQFVIDQMNVAPTYHREYYRLRANTLMPNVTISGEVRGACQVLSRWEKAVFDYWDFGRTFTVVNDSLLFVNGELRTQITPAFLTRLRVAGNGPYALCDVSSPRAVPGARINFRPTWSSNCANGSWVLFNPEVFFNASAEPPASRVLHRNANLVELSPPVRGVRLLGSASGSSCSQPTNTNNVYAVTAAGEWYRFSPRLKFVTNTLESPFNSTGVSFARPFYNPNVPKTFLNEKFCFPSSAGTPPVEYISAPVTLNDTVIRKFFELSTLYVYYITGLPVSSGPCVTSRARFVQKNGTCTTSTASATALNFLRGLIQAQSPNNTVRVVDITTGASSTCSAVSAGVELTVGSVCWQHVHSDAYNVYDFTAWVNSHPGGAAQIRSPASSNKVNLEFPSDHPIARWTSNYQSFPYLGIYGRTVDFLDLDSEVQKFGIGSYLNAVKTTVSGAFTATELCGSPGEIANDPYKGNRYSSTWNFDTVREFFDVYNHTNVRGSGKHMLWTNIALKADDQLRQRVAWALAQIFVVTENDIDRATDVEWWANYYDIFVRNAFGNYFDVLKEVSYSPMMGSMLSFRGSRSFQRVFESTGVGNFPDENYAREIMQLFTIGLWKLHKNGTFIINDQGIVKETYTNADIQTFARVWTGFRAQSVRGNFESPGVDGTTNLIDPMNIEELDHDTFPKQGLDGIHIGDEYPLCRNLPPRAFLRKGAQYRYLGSSTSPIIYRDRATFDLDFQNSQLYEKLCNADSSGACRLKSLVTLTENLACFGPECNVDVLRMVRVRVTATDFVNFEYVQVPCVELEFPEQGRVIVTTGRNRPVCVDARSIKAAAVCCLNTTSATAGVVYKNYDGEQVTYAKAETMCAAASRKTCAFRSVSNTANMNRLWSSDSCINRAQVFSDGRISVAILSQSSWAAPYLFGLEPNSNIKIRVNWANGAFPTVADSCGNGVCQVLADSCLCNTTAASEVVFTDASNPPSAAQILSRLSIGAVDPSMYDAGVYTLATSNVADGVKVWVDSTGMYNDKTIFEVRTTGSRVRYFANVRSSVRIETAYSFRNPPNFMQHEERTFRDVTYEVDAVLNHLLYHPNTAPFIADFMIKRFVSSNPSPAYVEAVAEAFMSGTYSGIGTGKYGDLAATIAAVQLYRDAVAPVLKADMSHGQVREPLIKVIHFMRSLEYVSQLNREVDLRNLVTYLGQQPHNAPSVFNYYQSEFQPAGAVANLNLVAPEAQVLTTPRVIGYLNAMIGLVEMGLQSCFFTFGYSLSSPNCGRLRSGLDNPRLFSSAYLNYSSVLQGLNVDGMIDKLDLLLTGGRLEDDRKDLLLSAYNRALNVTNSTDEGVRSVIELFAATPEFQVTSLAQPMDIKRPEFTLSGRTYDENDYKAIVFVFLNGGADSHNLIVPHSGCGTLDLYQQYRDIRTDAAVLKEALLRVQAPAWGTPQPCSTFGINPSMPFLAELYNSSEALFIANIGTLVEPLTLTEYQRNLKRVPRGLFGHNTQQKIIRNLDATDFSAKGVLGRIHDAMTQQGKIVDSYSVSGSFSTALEGEPGISEGQAILDQGTGVSSFDQDGLNTILRDYVLNLTVDVTHSILADTWNGVVKTGIERSSSLRATLAAANITANFAQYSTSIANQLGHVSRIIASRSTLKGSNLFNVEIGGFDTHASFTAYGTLMGQVDTALREFVRELKRQDVWEKVTIVVASDFARTLGSNGQGTDHGWGGNTFVLGGSVKGGQILGTYPASLAEGGGLNVGNGRVLPTTPWEALWNGVASWYGVDESKMNTVLPNRENFLNGGDYLFSESTMYK